MVVDLMLSMACILLLIAVYFLREGHKILQQNLLSYADYNDELMAQLRADAERARYFESLFTDWTENVEKLLTLMEYKHDCLRFDQYSHLFSYWHGDAQGQWTKPEPIIEREFNMAQLKDSIEERSRAYGIPMATQYYRHREETKE